MESEMKSAWIKAGLKITLGFACVGAVIGIRIVSLTPNRAESDTPSLERVQPVATAETSRVAQRAAAPSAVPGPEASPMDRLSSGTRERPRVAMPSSRDGDRMVSCRLAGRTQFMTADDCGMRGGRSTLLKTKR
jgi:hypothetical protein